MSLIEIRCTADGSPTLVNTEFGSTYHSDHGAIQESLHVFINAGLNHLIANGAKQIRIFEMGFGSGLNAALTLAHAQEGNVKVEYTSVECAPVDSSTIAQFGGELDSSLQNTFSKIHEAAWGQQVEMSEQFQLLKLENSLEELEGIGPFDLIFYDAFEPRTQPKLWTMEVFQKLAGWLETDGVLVTYCAKGQVRRDLEASGFSVERIPGPPGKREMIRATLR